MNKKIGYSVMWAGLALASAFGQEQEQGNRFYAELKGGLGFHQKVDGMSFKTGYSFGGEFGFCYESFRFGVELGYFTIKTKDYTDNGVTGHDKLQSFSGMVNVYYDYALTDAFNLYVGAGLGATRLKSRWETAAARGQWESETKFSYQLMAGISYDINENWSIKTGYKFTHVPSVKKCYFHGIEAGLRYSF